jgi:hypothetical protein
MADRPECPGLIPRFFAKTHEGETRETKGIRTRSGAKADFSRAPAVAPGS